MGQEIERSDLTDADREAYRARLRDETKILKRMFDEGRFDARRPLSCGLEVEAWLVDEHLAPKPCNDEFLRTAASPALCHELSQFNFEMNSEPRPLAGDTFSQKQAELEALWRKCETAAGKVGARPLLAGILPTLTDDVLSLERMSRSHRYHALNTQLFGLRKGQPIALDIEGRSHVRAEHEDVMLEAACTSIQVHLRIPEAEAARTYNAAQILSAPLVAATANSPFLFGHSVWEETRIPVFEQAVSLLSFRDLEGRGVGRVTFGAGYVRRSLLELFLENLDAYPVLLPLLMEETPEHLTHLRLQNGTIWRWNRPIVGFGADGEPHLRLEQRVMAAGPTFADILANTAFCIGLLSHYVAKTEPAEANLPFEAARTNFYAAARHGIDASVSWCGESGPMRALLLNRLVGEAKDGLRRAGIAEEEIDFYLEGIIKERVRTGKTGAAWQRQFADANRHDFRKLTERYAELQAEGKPVHLWPDA